MYKKPNRFPLTGPLEVTDYKRFLETSKTQFFQLWDLKWKEDFELDDFIVRKELGSGSFGLVFLVQHKIDQSFYAQKAIDKVKLIRTRQIEHTKNEMNILKCLNYPFTIFLEHYFKDNSYLYFNQPFISGGDLFHHIRQQRKFNEQVSKFLGAQVILGIDYLHSLDIAYRDLKPENLLIDITGYLKIADFGFSKILKNRTYTLCGTPEYLAPEIVLNKGYGKSVDWWAVGILLYEMVAGKTPFYHKKSMAMYEKATAGKFIMPPYFSSDLQDILKHIIQPDLTRRYGNLQNGAEDIKTHQWFSTINWLSVFNRQIDAPFKPKEMSTEASEVFPTLKIAAVDAYKREFETF